MIRKLVYRQNPDALRDGVPPEEFVDALEAEIAAVPRFREAAVEVRFEPCLYSGLMSVDDDDVADRDPLTDELRDTVEHLARRAWDACLAAD